MNARIADQVTARVAGRRSAENPCKWASRTVCGTMLEPDSRPARGCKRARARARDYARATRRACAREGGQRAPAGVSEERDSNVFGRGDVPGSTMTQGRVASRTPRTLPTTRPLANLRTLRPLRSRTTVLVSLGRIRRVAGSTPGTRRLRPGPSASGRGSRSSPSGTRPRELRPNRCGRRPRFPGQRS